MRLRILTDLFRRNSFGKPCNTQSIPAVFHLFLTKNLSPDSLADLYGIALTDPPYFFNEPSNYYAIIKAQFKRTGFHFLSLLWKAPQSAGPRSAVLSCMGQDAEGR